MKTLIFAAGRGERMRPLTDTTPKPLLVAGGKPLIVWHLERLAAAGLTDVVINCAHLADQLQAALGDGSAYGVAIAWSREPEGALETAGGIAWARPLLDDAPFLVVNGDVWCDWDVARAPAIARRFTEHQLDERKLDAHLVLVDNPPQHAHGDFGLSGERVTIAGEAAEAALTYAGIGVFSPALCAGVERGRTMKLRPLFDAAIAADRITGERHGGGWVDVGTPQRLAELDRALQDTAAAHAS
jgi:MurNAc alpha-1-phosphate uridylyltransferase